MVNTKVEIFQAAFLRAMNDDYDVPSEMEGLEDENGRITFKDVMHNMIRIEAQGIILEKYYNKYNGNIEKAQEEYDLWCDLASLDMYNDLWKWLENGCPFAISDADCIETLGFTNTNWNKI
jgi:hypothetical protein